MHTRQFLLSLQLEMDFFFFVFAHLVGVSEPRRAFLLTAHERDPLVATAAKPLPDVRVPVHAARLARLGEGAARGGADAVREALVVPEGRVLEYQPPARLTDAAPPLALVAVAPDPPRRVQVAVGQGPRQQ